jgi:predicted ABC-type ATPase
MSTALRPFRELVLKKLKILLLLSTCMRLQCFAFTFSKAGTVWADNCAKGIGVSSFVMLEEIDECVDAGHSFAFESTLSGLIYLRKISLWQAHGYKVKLWFLSLPNEDIAVSRVAHRVQQGGHNIPEDVIRRRFKAGLANFQI